MNTQLGWNCAICFLAGFLLHFILGNMEGIGGHTVAQQRHTAAQRRAAHYHAVHASCERKKNKRYCHACLAVHPLQKCCPTCD